MNIYKNLLSTFVLFFKKYSIVLQIIFIIGLSIVGSWVNLNQNNFKIIETASAATKSTDGVTSVTGCLPATQPSSGCGNVPLNECNNNTNYKCNVIQDPYDQFRNICVEAPGQTLNCGDLNPSMYNCSSFLCNAPPPPPGVVNGACTSPQTHYACSTGTSANNSTGTSSWTWNCNGSGGGSNAACQQIMPTATLTANYSAGSYTSSGSGAPVILRWSSTNITVCASYGSEFETNDEPSNSTGAQVNPTETTTYKIGCQNSNGDTAYSSVQVIVPTPKPDLTAGTVSAPSPAEVNVPVNLTATISNIGNASTGASFYNFFQETDTDPTGGTDPTLFNSGFLSIPEVYASGVLIDIPADSMSALGAGGSATASHSYPFPSTGIHYVRACADKSSSGNAGTIAESNENNNCGNWTAVTVNPASALSLSASPTSLSITQNSSGTSTITTTRSNVSGITYGSYPTSGTFSSVVFNPVTNILTVTTDLNSASGSVRVTANGLRSDGITSIFAFVDIPITVVGLPDLVASNVSATPNPVIVNSPVNLSATVTNQGTVSTPGNSGFYNFFQTTDTAPTAGIDSGTYTYSFLSIPKVYAVAVTGGGLIDITPTVYITPPAIGPNGTRPISSSYTFTSTGTHWVRACADKSSSGDTGTISESNEDNNCSPSWTTITVNPAPTGTLTGPDCQISANANTCPTTLTLNITSPISGAATNITKAGNVVVATGITPTSKPGIVVSYPSTTFYLNHDGETLASTTTTASCASHSHWDTTSHVCLTDTFTVTPSANTGGSISPTTPQPVNYGSPAYFTITPNSGYSKGSVGGPVGGSCPVGSFSGNIYTTGTITNNCTVIATFTINQYLVRPSAGTGGTISPGWPQSINYGSSTAPFTITAYSGYSIGPVGGTCAGTLTGNTYVAGPITGECTVIATFTINPITGVCSSPPTHYNCSAGTSVNNAEGPAYNWTWDCNGSNGGGNISCSQPIPPPTNPSSSCPNPGTTASLSWTLPSGYTLSYLRVFDNVAGSYAAYVPEWSADSGPSFSFTSTPGHDYTAWVHTRLPSGAYSNEIYKSFICALPGVCGLSDGMSFYVAPTGGYCDTGSASSVSWDGTKWTWSCSGSYSGGTASCSAKKAVDCVGGWGICSKGSQTYSVAIPAANDGLACPNLNGDTQACGNTAACASTHWGCSPGTSVSNSGPSYSGLNTNYSWGCNSTDGGIPASCTQTLEMSGTLSASPLASCTIASGSSSCNIKLNWGITNPQKTSTAITATEMPDINVTYTLATYQSGVQSSVPVPHDSRIFYLYNNGQLVGQTSATASCGANNHWDSSNGKCVLDTHTVTASAGTGGTISPSTQSVPYNSTANLTVTANTGYSIDPVGGTCPQPRILVDTPNSPYSYTTGPITNDCTVIATFTINSIDGVCSSPQTHYSCDAGTSVNNVSGSSAWTWSCNGSNGGTDASCSETKSSTGSFTPHSASCVIPAESSSCNVNISWSTTNPIGTSAVTSNYPSDNTIVANGNTGTSLAVPYLSSPRTFYLYNGGYLLDDPATGTSSCDPATSSWDGSKCVYLSPTVTISADPTTIAYDGSSTLTWSSENVTSCTARDDWSGTKATSGSQSTGNLDISKTYTYTLSCTGAGGDVSNSATVTVGAAALSMSGTLTPAASSCEIKPNQSSCPMDFTWSIIHPETIPTAITAAGMTPNINVTNTFDTPQSGTQSALPVPYPSRTFYLYNHGDVKPPLAQSTVTSTCAPGTSWDSSSNKCVAFAPVTPTVTLLANGQTNTTINSGSSATLSWSSNNASSCNASWTTSTATSGTQIVSPIVTTGYSIKCTNNSVDTFGNATVTVTVKGNGSGGTGGPGYKEN